MDNLRLLAFTAVAVCGLTSTAFSQRATESEYPHRGILPKAETGALAYLEEHPQYDGRNVLVAIFDTGVDPGAAGLAVTSDGKPKIVDLVDGTGAGDVRMGTVQNPTEGKLTGLSGQTLTIGTEWKNPSGEYRLGIKRAYEFFPGGLIARLRRERREAWDIAQREAVAAAQRAIHEFDTSTPSPDTEGKANRRELVARAEQLEQLAADYNDPGPLYDCVVWHDGDVWRAVVDTDEDGDLAEEEALTDFRKERQHDSFGGDSLLNFAVNIYEEGETLSIVTDSGPHGTHVAGIVAAHFENRPELNGIAPGAQIISVKIGDSRMSGMETGGALVRGLRAVLDHQCDLINMSFGEPTFAPNQGRLVELFSEVVNEHGVIFVASAGNDGPALSTVGAPGGTTSAILGVGAYISPEMMSAEYALRQELPETTYTWTSRGPTRDGDLGVNIAAPGGAISPVPQWTLHRNQRMNGTSMASPNACGNIALLLSGLKQNDIAYRPHTIRRALENTARAVDGQDVFAVGQGIVQVNAAYAYLTELSELDRGAAGFEFAVHGERGGRGIYLREPGEFEADAEFNVTLAPRFRKSDEKLRIAEFELPVQLKSTAEWITSGSSLALNSSGQTFGVHVDPSRLAPGVHYAEIQALDARFPNHGPLARLPVIVIRPHALDTDSAMSLKETVSFKPGQIERRFFAVPKDAGWMEVEIRANDTNASRRFMLRPYQLPRGKSPKVAHGTEFVTVADGVPVQRRYAVDGGQMLELCLGQYWSSLGATNIDLKVRFGGVVPVPSTVNLYADQSPVVVDVTSPHEAVKLAPRGELTTRRRILTPDSSEIRPLSSDRDLLPEGRQIFQLINTYDVTFDESTSITLHCPVSEKLLYGSQFGTFQWMLFDSAKRRVAVNDMIAESTRVQKGSCTLRVQLRHSDRDALETMESLTVFIDQPLDQALKLPVYASYKSAAERGAKAGSTVLTPGEQVRYYFGPPTEAPGSAGDLFVGRVYYAAEDDDVAGGSRKGGFPVRYAAPREKATRNKPTTGGAGSELKSAAERIADAGFQARVDALATFDQDEDKEAFQATLDALLDERPGDRSALVARLHWLDAEAHRKSQLDDVVAAADAVLGVIDTEQLATALAVRVDEHDVEAVQARDQAIETRDLLADTLYRKGRALGYMELPDVLESHPIEDPDAHHEAFEANFAELRKWVDTGNDEYSLLEVRYHRRRGDFGQALELLSARMRDAGPNRFHLKKRRDLLQSLGWDHAYRHAATWYVVSFPNEFEGF